MDNIINFPTWLVEKERDLSKLEHDLIIERMYVEREKSKIKQGKQEALFRGLMCFSAGIVVGIVAVLIMSL